MKKNALLLLALFASVLWMPSQADDLLDFEFPSGGKGTEADPFRMNTIADFRYLHQWVMGGVNFQGYYFCMQNDVDFASADKVDFAGGNFVAIGETSYGYSSFSGTFDGKGHTIKNMKVIRQTVTEQGLWGIANNAALFGYLKDATVKNIIIDENSAFTAQTYKASIAAQCEHSTISGCVSYAHVSASTGPTAGIVAQVYGDSDGTRPSTISDCRFAGTVEGSNYTGGIVGNMESPGNTITGCTNEGTITGTYRALGGIAGYVNRTTVSNCTNRGEISTRDPGMSATIYVGGIIGYLYDSSMDHCTNEGFVKGQTAGGVVGLVENSEVSYCTNTADVEVRGGIAYACSYDSSLKHCTNSGSVKGDWEMTAAIVLSAAPEQLEENYYTQNVVTYWGYEADYTTHREVSGFVSRGYNASISTLQDIVANNGAVLREAVIAGQQAAGSYWGTFYRKYGNYKVGEHTKAYTTALLSGEETTNGFCTLVLQEITDGIIPAAVPVILRSTQPTITLTITSETGTAIADKILTGYDGPTMSEAASILRLTTDGPNIQFSRYDNAIEQPCEAYVRSNPRYGGGELVAIRLQLDGQALTGIPTPATGISLAEYTDRMQIGQTQQMVASIYPADAINKKVVWTSSDEKVLTVDADGVVTAVGAGRANIKATADDQTYASLFTLSATTEYIQVTEPRVEVESIVINEGDLWLSRGDTRQLTVTILPENATDKSVSWDSSSSNVRISNGQLTVRRTITDPVTITATASNGLTATITVYDAASSDIRTTSSGTSAGTDTWYDLNGRRLQGRPTRKGVYLRNGKKTVY